MYENESLKILFHFLAEYAGTKTLDTIIEKINRPAKEQNIDELAYCLLTESLEEFCSIYNFEFDKYAILETFSFSLKQLARLNCDKELKLIIENALGLEISPIAFTKWIEILHNYLVSSKYEKLFKALQLQNMNPTKESFTEPLWMQKNLIDNFFEIHFQEQDIFLEIYCNISTNLSKECWLITRQLLMELLLNAIQHGNANQFSLLIEKDQISIKDNGTPFDTHTLVNKNSKLSGGNRTLLKFMQQFSDVIIKYTYCEQKNLTTISFNEPVFNVNSLCEIEIPNKYLFSRPQESFSIRYPTSKAKYYYADFAKNENSFWTISGVIGTLEKLISFCITLNSEVFLYIPNSIDGWGDEDYFAKEVLECITSMNAEDKIHVVRD